jgi:hypothetical protein
VLTPSRRANSEECIGGLPRVWISREYPQGWNGSRVKRFVNGGRPFFYHEATTYFDSAQPYSGRKGDAYK